MSKLVGVVVQDIPADVRAALVADAAERDISINEAAVSVLAEYWGVERTPSTRPYRGEVGSTQLLLSVPDALRTAIRLYAARTGETMRAAVIMVLSKHYNIPVTDSGRRARTVA